MTALTIDRLSAKIATLSPDQQRSVLEFVEFLQRPSSSLSSPAVALTTPQNFTSNDFDDW